MSVQDNIYRYFDSNPGLRVLFVFNPLIDNLTKIGTYF